MRRHWFVASTLALVAALPAACAFSKSSDVAAKVGSRTIRLSEIDATIKPELARIESERYEARKAKLDQLVDEALLGEKAAALGITKDELVKREVLDKTTAPSEDDVKATYAKIKAPPGTTTLEQLAPRIREVLASQAATTRRNAYLAELRQEGKVRVKLDPPRVTVDTSAGRVEGAKDAPITFVEFSDYQCPYCARSQEAVGKVLDKYQGKVLHIFMDFPITNLHPAARQAAVASHCADEQGKYHEYQELLFKNQREFGTETFKKLAAELGLDAGAFEQCVALNKWSEQIDRSVQAGQAVGVTGTPGFFINGISIKGSQPFEVFERTIEDELARAK